MKYLKLFESFDDNKEVVDTLKDILSCIKSSKRITSKLNGGTLMDLHDKCSDTEVMDILSKAAEIAGEEAQGTTVDLKTQFDVNEIEKVLVKLEANPEKAEIGMRFEKFSKFISESHNKIISLSEDEMRLFSDVPALEELISGRKITLKNGQVLYDENDSETRDLLDQYLEIPGKLEESYSYITNQEVYDNGEIEEKTFSHEDEDGIEFYDYVIYYEGKYYEIKVSDDGINTEVENPNDEALEC